jgi:beta-phosphoglucomutase-like phosphatase (HAD superfamily)
VLRAILFDFNGVLVDDEPLHLEMFQRVLGEEGIPLAADVVVLTPAKPELERRIKADPQRHRTTGRDLRLVEQWYARERADDVGHVRRGCDVNGNPLDELHPWRQEGARGGMRESHGRNF